VGKAKYRQRRGHLEEVARDTGFGWRCLGSQATGMLVPEHSRPTRGRSTRKYYIGAGRAGEWGLKSDPGSLGRRLGLPSVSHLGSKG
jgi:hypothetical protein